MISAQPSATRFTGGTYTRERPLLVSLDDTDPGLIRTLARSVAILRTLATPISQGFSMLEVARAQPPLRTGRRPSCPFLGFVSTKAGGFSRRPAFIAPLQECVLAKTLALITPRER